MKLFLIPSLLTLVLFLSGCATPVEAPEKPNGETKEALITDDYVGMSIEEAQAHAKARNEPFRIVKRDGEPLPVTMDYRVGRINAVVEDGVVVSYQVEGQENQEPEKKTYNQNSWKTMIAESCESFFDGCNTCKRMPGQDMAACTRMACQNYEKPRCLDQNSDSQTTGASSFGGRNTSYKCAEGNTFRVANDQYIDESGVVRLQPDQVMFEDDQTESKVIMNRTVAASGEKYESPSGLVFWRQGLTARVMQGEENLYEDCEEV